MTEIPPQGCIKRAAFAARHGKSRMAVTKWERRGLIVLVEGLVDVSASEVRLRGAGLHSPILDAEQTAAGDIDDDSFAAFLRNLAAGRYGAQADADRVKANALAGIRALELRRAAGSLMEVSTAETLFFEAARSERDHWMNWPARVGPELAARFDIPASAVTAELLRLIHSELADRGEPEADFGARAN